MKMEGKIKEWLEAEYQRGIDCGFGQVVLDVLQFIDDGKTLEDVHKRMIRFMEAYKEIDDYVTPKLNEYKLNKLEKS